MKTMYILLGLKLVIAILLFGGYIQCVYKLVKCDFSNETSYKAEIIYGFGSVTGIGAIIGWLDLGK